MESTVGERIREIIECRGLSVSAFAKEIGVAQTSLREVVAGNAEPRHSTLVKILVDNLFVNRDWLITGKGKMVAGSEVKQEILCRLNTYRQYLECKDSERFDLFMNSLRCTLHFDQMTRFVMDYDNLSALTYNFPDLNLNWVFTGEEDMLKAEGNAGRDNAGVGNKVGDNEGIIGNHVSIADANNIKKIMGKEGTSIEFAQSADVLQQRSLYFEQRIKDLEALVSAQADVIEMYKSSIGEKK